MRCGVTLFRRGHQDARADDVLDGRSSVVQRLAEVVHASDRLPRDVTWCDGPPWLSSGQAPARKMSRAPAGAVAA